MPRYTVILKPSAIRDFDRLRKFDAAMIADGVERFLSHDPARLSRSRIKRLRGAGPPDFRLRLDAFRVFYNVDAVERSVDVLRILHKKDTAAYYKEIGT